MNKENPKKNKKSFEYYIAQRKEEFRCQYDHERSWENLQYKGSPDKPRGLSIQLCKSEKKEFYIRYSS